MNSAGLRGICRGIFDRFPWEGEYACNMSIEGGARVGYVNPDDKTFEYLRGRPYAPKDAQWDESVKNGVLPRTRLFLQCLV